MNNPMTKQVSAAARSVELPEGFDFRNGGQHCDMLVGPCACGAWHKWDDLRFRILNQLRNYQTPVVLIEMIMELWLDKSRATLPSAGESDERLREAIERICPKCGHDTTVDGCANCLKDELQDRSARPTICTRKHRCAEQGEGPCNGYPRGAALASSPPPPQFFVGQVLSCQHGPPDNIFHFRVETLGTDGKPSQMKLVALAATATKEEGQ